MPKSPRYYVKETDILYRNREGDIMPNQVLTSAGWVTLIGQLAVSPARVAPGASRGGDGNAVDPAVLSALSEIDFAEAQEIAAERRLPLDGWE